MAEKPIIFSGDMVNAILNGSKTQTRRVAKNIPDWANKITVRLGYAHLYDSTTGYMDYRECPYGSQPNLRTGEIDYLWVRETFNVHNRHVVYRADCGNDGSKWKPSIYMPRWASRITLKIENVRLERLQIITEDDAAAEGIPRHTGPYILDFARLWDSINAKRGYAWKSNPWVWVIEFSKV